MAIQHVPSGKQITVVGPAKVNIAGRFEKFITQDNFVLPATPTLTSLSPNTAVHGTGADFIMDVNGTGFLASSKIIFNGGEEPTTFVSATKLQTAVRPSLAGAAVVVPVLVRTFTHETAPQNFTFT
jgi:hypothetical protein